MRRARGGAYCEVISEQPYRPERAPDRVTQIGHEGILGAAALPSGAQVVEGDWSGDDVVRPAIMGTMQRTNPRGAPESYGFIHNAIEAPGRAQVLLDDGGPAYVRPPSLTGSEWPRRPLSDRASWPNSGIPRGEEQPWRHARRTEGQGWSPGPADRRTRTARRSTGGRAGRDARRVRSDPRKARRAGRRSVAQTCPAAQTRIEERLSDGLAREGER
jgi:hypothetical protein